MKTEEMLHSLNDDPKAKARVYQILDKVQHHLPLDRIPAFTNLLHAEFWTEECEGVDWTDVATSFAPTGCSPVKSPFRRNC